MNNNLLILKTIESVLGSSKQTSKGNYSFNCPYCYKNNHKPKKLEININTHQYQCWICGSEKGGIKGKNLLSLFKRANASSSQINELKSFSTYTTTYKTDIIEDLKPVELPKEYKPLFNLNKRDIIARHALTYIKRRGLTVEDILKYQIGYCESGHFANKIIIPNYSSEGKLNYFIARSFEKDPLRKYDAPSADKNSIIGFENLINWNLPIILCEGAFDAIAIKRNAIPLYGKTLSRALTKKLLSNNVKNIYLALDNDALKSTLKIAGDLLQSGKKIYVIRLDGKDPSDIGFEHFTNLVQHAKQFTFSDLFSLKLEIQ